jgi:hypothetical protein
MSTMRTWTLRRKVVLAVVVFAVIVGVYPVSSPLCPKWDVIVVDKTGNPLADMTVRRSCNNYSTGGHSEDDRKTDERGKASFDIQPGYSPILIRWLGNVINVATQGVHASFGRHSYVFTFGGGWRVHRYVRALWKIGPAGRSIWNRASLRHPTAELFANEWWPMHPCRRPQRRPNTTLQPPIRA